MSHRVAISACLVALVALGGCTGEPAEPEGVCCAPAASPCDASNERGGWAPSEADCAEMTIDASDGQFLLQTDERGCEHWEPGFFCTGDEDGVSEVCCGGPAPDGGP